MSRLKTEYGTAGQAITITLASLGAGSSRESTVVDNTTDRFLDALVQVKVRTNGSAPTGDKAVYVYGYGTADNGTTYPDTVTGSDAAITLTSPTQLRLLGVINCPAASTTYKSPPFSVASLFGGVLPLKWGIVITNATGNALDSTGSNFAAFCQGIRQELMP